MATTNRLSEDSTYVDARLRRLFWTRASLPPGRRFGKRVSRTRPPSRLAISTIAFCLIQFAIAAAFLWGRQASPAVALKVNPLAWSWSADGVAVVDVPGRATVKADPGNGDPEDDRTMAPEDAVSGEAVQWVKGLDGQSLESWISHWSWFLPKPADDGLWPVTITADCRCTLDGGRPYHGDLTAHAFADVESITDLLAPAGLAMSFLLLYAAIALATWLMRPSEGWRCGFMIGSAAIITFAVVSEVGLRPTDLQRTHPMVVLYALSLPLLLIFWSSVVHVIAQLPSRGDPALRGPHAVGLLYGAPQVLFVGAMLVTRVSIPSTMAWIGTWAWTLNALVFGLGLISAVALIRVRQRTVGERWVPAILVAPLVLCGLVLGFGVIGGAAVLLIALALVGGSQVGVVARRWRLTGCAGVVGLAGLALVSNASGQASQTGAMVALVSLAPPSLLLLGIAVLRYRVYDIDVYRESRRRAIITREGERRRIRRDLHDGLGPMLASMTLNLDLARSQARTDPEASIATIERVKGDTQTAVTEIRRLVRDLRPSALDDLGLVEALRQRLDDMAGAALATGTGPSIEMDAVGLPKLDAASEVAAYLIVLEAVTNVIRHASATRCLVRLSVSDGLDIEVADDGVGVDPSMPPGVGITAMRERAAELGGAWRIDRTSDGWTRVSAHLPIQQT